MALALKNLSETDLDIVQSGNMGGLIDKIYVAERDDVESLNYGTDEQGHSDPLKVLSVTMKAGKTFKSIYFTPQTGKIMDAVVGEVDGKSTEPQLEFSIPKSSHESKRLKAFFLNSSLIFITQNSNGLIEILGTKEIPCKFETGATDSGAKYADKNHTPFVFKSGNKFGVPVFEGNLSALVQDTALEGVNFTATAAATTETIAITWVNNAASFPASASATDSLQVTIENKTTGDRFDRSNVAIRSAGTASIVVFNIAVGNIIEVTTWFRDGAKISTKRKVTVTAT